MVKLKGYLHAVLAILIWIVMIILNPQRGIFAIFNPVFSVLRWVFEKVSDVCGTIEEWLLAVASSKKNPLFFEKSIGKRLQHHVNKAEYYHRLAKAKQNKDVYQEDDDDED